MGKQLRVMAIGAHPDDPEIYSGGTLAKYAANGHMVFIAYVTDGTAGGRKIDSAKLAEIREKETKDAARVIGAESIWIGLPDAELENNFANRLKIIDAIRQAKPDIIITHPPYDQNSDHRITSELVNDANLHASFYKHKTKHERTEVICPIYYMEPYLGVGFLPSEYVDVTDTFQTKLEMFMCHKSQMDFLSEEENTRSGKITDDVTFPLGWIGITARFRGFQAMVQYAEAFQPLIIGQGIRTDRLLP
jgi:N-acetylglucosamine malate deacetylase 1